MTARSVGARCGMSCLRAGIDRQPRSASPSFISLAATRPGIQEVARPKGTGLGVEKLRQFRCGYS
jgi:hypothetical protein